MNILIPVILGSEVRQFIWSGVISDLIDKGDSVFLSVRNIDSNLFDEIMSFDSRINFCAYHDVNIKRSALSYLQLILDFNYDKTNNRWLYSQKKNIPKIKTYLLELSNALLHINLVKKNLLKFEQFLLNAHKTIKWDIIFKENKIDCIIVNVPRLAQQINIAAKRYKIPVILLFHTNKDISAMLRPNYDYSIYGVWNEQMKNELLVKIPHSEKNRIKIVGNTHFSCLNKKNDDELESILKRKFQIADGEFVILYTAASPIVIKNEHTYIKDLTVALKDLKINEYKIIVRKNPMDHSNTWEQTFEGNEKVLIQIPNWYWNKKYNFNYTHYSDSEEYSFLLKHANVCINIPSSVTIEAAIYKLPIVNICYGSETIELLSVKNISDFWNAHFYKQYHKYDFIIPVHEMSDFKNILLEIFKSKKRFKDYENCIKETLSVNINEIKAKVVSTIHLHFCKTKGLTY